jgi:DNA-binding MarR family transcriptional regulator
MEAIELFLLGRRLMKLGEEAMPAAGFRRLPASVQSILIDALEHPGSTIGEITRRTGFPQSHVSVSVERFKRAGALVTEADVKDRRRTLVRPTPGVRERAERLAIPIEPVLAKAFRTSDASALRSAVAALEALADRLLESRDRGQPPEPH